MIDWSSLLAVERLSPFTLALIVGAIVMIALLGPTGLMGSERAANTRRAMLERHGNALRSASLSRPQKRRSVELAGAGGRLKKILSILPSRYIAEKQKDIRRAGINDSRALTIILISKFLIPFAVFLITVIIGKTLKGSEFDVFLGFPEILIILFTFFFPDVWIKYRRKKRQAALEQSLPDGLDLLVICAEAGLSLDAALKRVADEFSDAVPEISEELFLTAIELSFLPNRRQALLNLAERVDLSDFRGVVATLVQTEKYGTPLAQALRTLSAEFREHRLLAAEEKAARLPAILTVPMILFILPALFIVLGGPAFLKVAEKFGG